VTFESYSHLLYFVSRLLFDLFDYTDEVTSRVEKDSIVPRKVSMFQSGIPCHVISSGNNHGVYFFTGQDYLCYLECLNNTCQKYDVVHAYVLMTNHVHLMITPSRDNGISKIMPSVGRRYVQYINQTLSSYGDFMGRSL
jgi:REP element-mobilizing transposase RayT